MERPWENYHWESELGAGGYGKVVMARQKNPPGPQVAAKIISLSRMKRTAIEKEVKLMESLDHANIIKLITHFVYEKNYCIIMELASGGELFSRVISSGRLTEAQARPYFAHLIAAVEYMHANGVVHRDLKLENILLDEYGNCKVCDFGLAHVYAAGEDPHAIKLKEVCGSKSYCAPEVLGGKGYVGFPTDVWSCGICLFAMLAGFFPLDEASGGDWRFGSVRTAAASGQSTCHTIYGFYERPCQLSAQVVALIDAMMRIIPEGYGDQKPRPTVGEVASDSWLQAPSDSASVYRSGGLAMNDPDAIRAMLAEENEKPQGPVYRGGGPPSDKPPSKAPGLFRQQAFEREL